MKLLDKEKILQISRNTKGSEAYGYQHLVVMLFGILKHFDSLRELEIGMKAEVAPVAFDDISSTAPTGRSGACSDKKYYITVR